MKTRNSYSKDLRLIVLVAMLGIGLAALFFQLDREAAQGCSLLQGTALIAFDILRSLVLSVVRCWVPSYLSDSWCLQHLLQIVATIWPVWCVA
jgi:hypothetical protein